MTQHQQLHELQHGRITEWEARYRARALQLEVLLQNGKDFLYPLARAANDRGLPMELALLPIIESGLNPSAVSPSGARGLWQILPATAEYLELKHDWWADDSADVYASTEAALNYLEYLHARFGSWLLTLAAYNTGEGRVAKAMRANREGGDPTGFWHLDLPRQTQQYVPKLLGLARVLRDPDAVRRPQVAMQANFLRVETGMPLDLMTIAELTRVPVSELYRLNPDLLRWTMPPSGPYAVYLPRKQAQTFADALRSREDIGPQRWHRHTVRPGESLSGLAQRFNSEVALVELINPGVKDGLKRGQILLIPETSVPLPPDTLAAARTRSRLDFQARPLPAGLHRVARGESLWKIARTYGTSVRNLRQTNALRSDALVPGQLLKVGNQQAQRKIVYQVKPGDILSRIALKHEVSVRQIQSWNQLKDTLLHPGQQLQLYLPREL